MDNAESAWIASAQKGDDQAFANLVEAYQRPVFNLCYRMLGDSYEAEDAAQEAFLRAYKNIKRYDPNRSFATWLLSIASHYCIDQIRRRRMQIVSLDAIPGDGETIPDEVPTPEAALRLSQEQQHIQELLGTLSALDRSAVVMYYWHECSYEEIAQALSLTISAVKSRLHRARRLLAESWQKRQSTQTFTMERKRHESPAF